VGTDVAAFMKGGVIRILGDSGPFLGFRMCDGTVHVEKKAGNRVGACMTGGKIVVSGTLEEVLPSFTVDSIKAKVKIEEGDSASGPFYLFLGDLAENGNGKLFISKNANPQIKEYERFL
jgi:formylmethanofuran dehydrogenase subunit C